MYCCLPISILLIVVSAPVLAGPDGSFVSIWACNLDVPGSNPGRVR